MLRFLTIPVLALSLGACASPVQQQRTAEGALLGGAAGAAVGALTEGTVEGAAAGAAIGAAGGAIIGAVASRPGYCYARDQYGNRIVVECPPGY